MAEILPPYVLKRSARSRRVRVSVRVGGEVRVSAPRRVAEEAIQSFLLAHAGWLNKKVAYFKKFPKPKLSLAQEKRLFKVYKQKALALAEAKVKQWNRHFKFSFKKIGIRNSKTRWGSCSARGTLSFNYKIVFLPEHLADYLIVHELCHLKEHNHSERFWSLLAGLIPDYAFRRKELGQFEKSFEPPAFEV